MQVNKPIVSLLRIRKKKKATVLVIATAVAMIVYVGRSPAYIAGEMNDITPSTPLDGSVDWKTFDVDTLPAESVMEYLYWSNRSSCNLVHSYGGSILNRTELKRTFRDYFVYNRSQWENTAPAGIDCQYPVCLDPLPIAPPSERCLVYSFGIRNEWSFDDAMADYGCNVYSFDPNMGVTSHQRSSKIHFFNVGISGRDYVAGGKRFRKLSSIHKKLQPRHGKKIIDYLKIDIEGNEWDVIPEIIDSGMLDNVRQLAMEIHLFDIVNFKMLESLDDYRRFVGIVKSLEDAGMVRFDSEYAPWCPAVVSVLNNITAYLCIEMAWYNSRFLVTP